MLVRKYVEENGSAAMLVAKRSVGAAPEVNLGIQLQVSKESDLGFETRADVTRSPKQGYQMPTKRIDVLQNSFLKKKNKKQTR